MSLLFPPPPIRCHSPRWAKGGHAQTIAAHLLPSPKLRDCGEDLEIALEDGDRLSCTLLPGESKTVVYVFHGLAGDANQGYMHRTAQVARSLGHAVVLVNHRGCGRGQGLARGIYHSGSAPDLGQVMDWGRKRFQGARHIAIGFSLSGNALLLLLTGARGGTQPDAAIAVNAPIHLTHAALRLRQGLNRLYDLNFVTLCRRYVRHRERRGLTRRKYSIPILASVYDLDEIYTAPEAGFASRQDYYDSCSAMPRLKSIRVPTVLLTAKDDPFVDYRDYLAAELSPTCVLQIEDEGGHMGYLSRSRTSLGTKRWLDYAIWHYLSRLGEPGVVTGELPSS